MSAIGSLDTVHGTTSSENELFLLSTEIFTPVSVGGATIPRFETMIGMIG